MPSRMKALKRNAKSAHALWQGVDPPSYGRGREGSGLKMPKAKRRRRKVEQMTSSSTSRRRKR